MGAVQITRFGSGPPRFSTSSTCPTLSSGDGEQLFDVFTAGVDYTDTHRLPSAICAEQASCSAQ